MENSLSLAFHEFFFPLLHKQAEFPIPSQGCGAQLALIRGSPALQVAKKIKINQQTPSCCTMQTLRPLSRKEKESAAGLWGEKLQVPESFAGDCSPAPDPGLFCFQMGMLSAQSRQGVVVAFRFVLFSIFKVFAFQMQIQKEARCP